MEYIKLNNGIEMPIIGYGTYLTSKQDTRNLVLKALNSGYRHIDTAQNYGNEHEVGLAVKESNIPREEIFITSKTQTNGYGPTKRGIEESLKEFGLDYIDLMIIHWPISDNIGTYRALEEAYKEGKVRSIGVSNFNEYEVKEIIDNFETKPVLDQIETHIFWQQKRMHKFLEENNIYHESWSPFGEGMNNIFNNETLINIGKKYNKTLAQVILRFLVQNNIIVIPKTTKEERMKENIDIFDFKLSDEDMNIISDLDKKKSFSNWPSSMKIEEEY